MVFLHLRSSRSPNLQVIAPRSHRLAEVVPVGKAPDLEGSRGLGVRARLYGKRHMQHVFKKMGKSHAKTQNNER